LVPIVPDNVGSMTGPVVSTDGEKSRRSLDILNTGGRGADDEMSLENAHTPMMYASVEDSRKPSIVADLAEPGSSR
jgi:hypothetical protein